MSRKGLLIDVEYCTGCFTCSVACKQEHGYEAGTFGIKVTEHIYPAPDGRVMIDFTPFPTTLCNLCAHRINSGEDDLPVCVRHCQAGCMEYGDADELIEKAKGMKRPVLYLERE